MKTFLHYNRLQNRIGLQVYINLILLFLSINLILKNTSVVYAVSKFENNEDQKIHVTSEILIVDGLGKYAEFIGNVKIVQGKTDIKSDKLKIYYKQKVQKTEIQENSIEKLVANGNVVMIFDDKTAYTNEAVYVTKTGIITLIGEGTTLKSNKNSISGNKITIYRNDDRIKVEGQKEKPVQGIFYSKEKGLN